MPRSLPGGVCAQRVHVTGGNWGFLLPLAIFLLLWTILHPTMLHNLMFHPPPPPPMPSTAPNCNLNSGQSGAGLCWPACLAWL